MREGLPFVARGAMSSRLSHSWRVVWRTVRAGKLFRLGILWGKGYLSVFALQLCNEGGGMLRTSRRNQGVVAFPLSREKWRPQ